MCANVIITDSPCSIPHLFLFPVSAVLLIAGIKNYHPAIGAILNQHAWNLFWFGSVTTVGAFFIWRASSFAMVVTALIGGFADVGYFVFLDIGGFVNFMPGTVMTIISATAIMLSMAVYVQIRLRAPL